MTDYISPYIAIPLCLILTGIYLYITWKGRDRDPR
jgi:hypothetical protein